jgi:hypothetical protein
LLRLGLLLRLLGRLHLLLDLLLLLRSVSSLTPVILPSSVSLAELGGDDLAHDPHQVAGEAGQLLLRSRTRLSPSWP